MALARWREGWLKHWVTHRLLGLRNRRPELFLHGSYEPLIVEGSSKNNIIAFQRRSDHGSVIVLVCRLLADKLRSDLSVFWPGSGFLGDATIRGAMSGTSVDEITGKRTDSCSRGIMAADALSALPVAVLVAD
jgi:maltooligosyltrehalose synthase